MPSQVTRALERLAKQQPDMRLALVHDEKRADTDMAWSVMIVFGQEAEDSDMVGGAAHGLAGSPEDALEQALRECRVWDD